MASASGYAFLMGKRIEKVGDWIGERGLPFEPQLAHLSDRLDEVKERREQKKSKDGDERSDEREGEQDGASSGQSGSAG